MLGPRGEKEGACCHSGVRNSSVLRVIRNKDAAAGTVSLTDSSAWLVYQAFFPGAQPCARFREALVKRQEETGLLQEVQLSAGHRLAARNGVRLCSCAGLAGPRVAVEKNSWRKET